MSSHFSSYTIPHPPTPTLFPYTTLFRSRRRPCTGPRTGSSQQHERPEGVEHEQQHGGVDDRPRRAAADAFRAAAGAEPDRKSTRLNSSHPSISYAVFCLKKKRAIE